MKCLLLALSLVSLGIVSWANDDTNVVPFTTKTGYYPLDSSTFIVGAMDGSIHGFPYFLCFLDRPGISVSNGEKLWSFSTGGHMYSSSHYPIIPGLDNRLHLYTLDGLKVHCCSIPPNCSFRCAFGAVLEFHGLLAAFLNLHFLTNPDLPSNSEGDGGPEPVYH